jgi:hypothetical protein
VGSRENHKEQRRTMYLDEERKHAGSVYVTNCKVKTTGWGAGGRECQTISQARAQRERVYKNDDEEDGDPMST